MSDTYKILGQALTGDLALDNSTVKETIVYEVPTNTQSAVSTIQITNSSPNSQTYRLSFVKDSEVEAAYADIQYSISTISKLFIFLVQNDFDTMYAEDAVNWTAGSSLPRDVSNVSWRGTAYGNGILVAPISDVLFYTTDGINWSSTSVPLGSYTSSNTVYGNGKFIYIAGNNQSAVSENGITWTIVSLPTPNHPYYNIEWKAIAYGNGRFVAIADGTNSIYSDDGINWYTAQFPGDLTADWGPVVYGDGKFLVLGQRISTNQTFIAYSTDGTAWNQYELTLFPITSSWASDSLIYGGGKFVGLNNNKVVYSTDGMNWSQSTLPVAAFWEGIVYGNGLFVTCPVLIDSFTQRYLISSDGITWTEVVINRPAEGWKYWSRVAYGEFGADITNTQSIPQSLNKHISVYNKTINSGETHEIKGGITLSAGDQIRAYSSSDDLIVNVYGAEIS